MDLISVYADGELKDPDTFQLEVHLSECDSCSALLEMYREISTAADEQSVDAPEALRIGVMNRIRNEEIFHTAGNVKRRKPLNIILMRYAPIAACLVVMLFVWQFWGSLWGAQDTAMAPAAEPQAAMDSLAPDAAPAPAESEPALAPPEAAPDAEPDAADAFTNSLDDINVEGEVPLDTDDADGSADDAGESADNADESAEDGDRDPRGGRSLPDGDRSAEETEQIMQYIDGAYAQITVTGELPDLLKDYDPQPFGSWFGWQMVFEIPSDKVPALMAELGDREGVSIIQIPDNSESTYAIVMFSPGL